MIIISRCSQLSPPLVASMQTVCVVEFEIGIEGAGGVRASYSKLEQGGVVAWLAHIFHGITASQRDANTL